MANLSHIEVRHGKTSFNPTPRMHKVMADRTNTDTRRSFDRIPINPILESCIGLMRLYHTRQPQQSPTPELPNPQIQLLISKEESQNPLSTQCLCNPAKMSRETKAPWPPWKEFTYTKDVAKTLSNDPTYAQTKASIIAEYGEQKLVKNMRSTKIHNRRNSFKGNDIIPILHVSHVLSNSVPESTKYEIRAGAPSSCVKLFHGRRR
ncbi:hypothetical protein E6O75_ATG07580 [Venturia nashicola]|uniref:Uncharacterized protein n=1 Tax=Venturia nashicola TaxID=86259 RepID=A0A4Z1P6J4_9PEZI|nr:hypothetical protein E6O75_ATG07580 [Venturia nashicola]